MNKELISLDKTSTAFKMLELSNDIYVLTDTIDNTVLDFSPKLSTLTQYPLNKIIGQSLHSLFNVDSKAEFNSIFGGYFQYIDEKYVQQLYLHKQDGTRIPTIVTAYQNRTDFGPKHVHCFFIREVQDKKLEQDVLEIKKMFQTVLNTIPSRIFWKDTNLNYLGCNSKFAVDAGLEDYKHIIGKSDYELAWTKEEADFYRLIDKRVIESGQAELNYEETQLNAIGDATWLETNKTPLINIKGETIGMLGTYTDITERKKSVDIIKNTNRELALKNKELEQFAHITSHDLQEPLRSMSSFIDLFLLEYADKIDENGKMYLKFVDEAANRMRNLITGLLEYSLLSLDTEKEQVDCNEVLQDVLDDLSLSIHENQAQIISKNTLPILLCNRIHIRIIFQNMIQNAMKFKSKNIPPIIFISTTEQGDFHQFTVTDNGIGFNPNYTDKIFILFQRLHNTKEYSGSGIGLAYCKKIIDLLGGSIWAESQEGKGSSFFFTIKKAV
ncbi:ATP-binding protein [uncultured Cytophaga sp.]|uniref:sensor histidine kinase n=1 Tax=uncultured Cytophaga sp. TaxID=160238 RepID=UPI0026076F55|nr:ATP-binding protein [uncultured Cytophaga sp.]